MPGSRRNLPGLAAGDSRHQMRQAIVLDISEPPGLPGASW
jgi:hypothetical protein